MIGVQILKSGILFLAAFLFAATLVSSSLTILNVHAQRSTPNRSVPNFTLKLVNNSYTVLPVYGTDPYTGQSVMTSASMSPSRVTTALPGSTHTYSPTNIGAADSVKGTASTSLSQTQLLVIIAVLLAVIVALIIILIIMNRSQIRNRWRSHSR